MNLRILGIWGALGVVYCGAMILLMAYGTATKSPWDAGWYNIIAFSGYQFNGNLSTGQTPAFFPMYPLLVRFMAWTTGYQPPLVNFLTSFLLLSGTMVFYAKIVDNLFPALAPETVVAVMFSNPFAIYLFNGYSEAAWLFAVSGFVLCMLRRNFFWAIVFINIGALARPYGILLVIVFAMGLLWRSLKESLRTGKIKFIASDIRPLLVQTPLAFISLIGFTLYLNTYFDDPLLFKHILYAWKPGEYNPSWLNLIGVGFFHEFLAELRRIAPDWIGIFTPRLWALVYLGFCVVVISAALISMAFQLIRRQATVFNPLLMTAALFLVFKWFSSPWHVQNSVNNLGRHLLPVYLFAIPAAMSWWETFINRASSLKRNADQVIHKVPCTWVIPVIILQTGLFVYFAVRFYKGLWVS
jgi:hypothetical protein